MIRISAFALGLSVMVLSSCSQRTPKPGQALIEINTDNVRSGRVGTVHFASQNGKELGGSPKYLHLAPGHYKIGLHYKLHGHSEMTTTLPFEAKADCRYDVRFDLYPNFHGRAPVPGEVPASMGLFGNGDILAGMIGLVALPVELGGRAAVRGAHNLRGNFKDVDWAHIDVISSELSEGIVLRTKVP